MGYFQVDPEDGMGPGRPQVDVIAREFPFSFSLNVERQ